MYIRGLLLILFYCAASSLRGDTVLLAAEKPGAPSYSVEGDIVDYTGHSITIARPGGTPRTYPADRVLKVETIWNDKHQSARAAMEKHDYPTALGLLAAADREEQRLWVRRIIGEEMVKSYAALGEWQRAGEVFIALTQSDSTTPAYRIAPLAWYPNTAVQPLQARSWLARSEVPVAVLLGASFLLTSTGDSQSATQALQALTRSEDPHLAALAETQLWRLELARVTLERVERWERRQAEFPTAIQAGPNFIIGEAWTRLGQSDRAALAYLRVPVLHEANRHLAARSLVSAALATHKGGHTEEAKQLLREVNAEYGDTPQQKEAEALLRTMGK